MSNLAFVPKVLTDLHLNQSVELQSLRLTQKEDEEDRDGSLLCLVRAVRTSSLFYISVSRSASVQIKAFAPGRGNDTPSVQRYWHSSTCGSEGTLNAGHSNLLGPFGGPPVVPAKQILCVLVSRSSRGQFILATSHPSIASGGFGHT